MQRNPPAPHSLDQQFNHLWHLVGNTPMLEIHYSYRGRGKIGGTTWEIHLRGAIDPEKWSC